jgi:hypothetical protein
MPAWRSSLIVFIYVVRVLLHGASKIGNSLAVEIFQTILVKSAPEIFRTK